MKAQWNSMVIAEAPREKLIFIEGNWYFPPDSIKQEFFEPNKQHTNCFWKGEASYYTITVNGSVNEGGAWYYPKPMQGAIDKVGADFSNYVAFWRGVVVE